MMQNGNTKGEKKEGTQGINQPKNNEAWRETKEVQEGMAFLRPSFPFGRM
jgi:hypothetical protein